MAKSLLLIFFLLLSSCSTTPHSERRGRDQENLLAKAIFERDRVNQELHETEQAVIDLLNPLIPQHPHYRWVKDQLEQRNYDAESPRLYLDVMTFLKQVAFEQVPLRELYEKMVHLFSEFYHWDSLLFSETFRGKHPRKVTRPYTFGGYTYTFSEDFFWDDGHGESPFVWMFVEDERGRETLYLLVHRGRGDYFDYRSPSRPLSFDATVHIPRNSNRSESASAYLQSYAAFLGGGLGVELKGEVLSEGSVKYIRSNGAFYKNKKRVDHFFKRQDPQTLNSLIAFQEAVEDLKGMGGAAAYEASKALVNQRFQALGITPDFSNPPVKQSSVRIPHEEEGHAPYILEYDHYVSQWRGLELLWIAGKEERRILWVTVKGEAGPLGSTEALFVPLDMVSWSPYVPLTEALFEWCAGLVGHQVGGETVVERRVHGEEAVYFIENLRHLPGLEPLYERWR